MSRQHKKIIKYPNDDLPSYLYRKLKVRFFEIPESSDTDSENVATGKNRKRFHSPPPDLICFNRQFDFETYMLKFNEHMKENPDWTCQFPTLPFCITARRANTLGRISDERKHTAKKEPEKEMKKIKTKPEYEMILTPPVIYDPEVYAARLKEIEGTPKHWLLDKQDKSDLYATGRLRRPRRPEITSAEIYRIGIRIQEWMKEMELHPEQKTTCECFSYCSSKNYITTLKKVRFCDCLANASGIVASQGNRKRLRSPPPPERFRVNELIQGYKERLDKWDTWD